MHEVRYRVTASSVVIDDAPSPAGELEDRPASSLCREDTSWHDRGGSESYRFRSNNTALHVSGLLSVDPGFKPDGVATMQISLTGTAFPDSLSVLGFQQRLLERVESLPGVDSAALAGQVPLGGNADMYMVRLREARPAGAAPLGFLRYSVSPSYLRVMGLPLIRGRFISAEDLSTSAPVVVLSESAAKAAWAAQDPLGRQIQIGGPDGPWRTVVGITGDVLHHGLRTASDSQMYLPQSQFPDAFLVLAIRSAGPSPETLLAPARDAVRAIRSTVPIFEVATYTSLIAKAVAAERFVMRLLTAFALVALLLAAVGLYGVVAYSVTNRRRELAVRLALGARTSHLLTLLLVDGAVALGGGVALGLAASYAMTGMLAGLLHNFKPFDPMITVGAVAVLVLVAMVAHALPIRRALNLSPAAALKNG